MSLKFLVRNSALVFLLGGLTFSAVPAAAYDRGSLEEIRAEREARRLERLAQREAKKDEPDEVAAAVEEERECECRAKVGFAKPQLTWRNGLLSFVPRVDVDVRVRGEADGPRWSVGLDYEGEASKTGGAPVAFSGHKEIVGGQCGNHRYSFDGIALPEVNMADIARAALGLDGEVAGKVRMKAELTGCDANGEDKQFGFEAWGLGNLKAGYWRRAR